MVIHALAFLREWKPFQIDALGLVTLLGASGADHVLGQLVANRFTEWLPMLAANIIASNDIVEPLSGFTLYNITDGMMATDMASWFCRWLYCQHISSSSSIVTITAVSPATARKRHGQVICARVLGVLLCIIPTAFAMLIGDWWGLANNVAMIVSVLVREVVLDQNRRALDRLTDEAEATETYNELVKVFVTLPNGNAITIATTRGIVVNCLLTNPRPPNPRLYIVARGAAWLAFGTHMITLGMATLFSQLITVALLVSVTAIALRQIGSDPRYVGRRLKLKREERELQYRAQVYAKLDLEPTEETSMVLWNLFPHTTNKSWWDKYRGAAQTDHGFVRWNKILAE